MAAMATVGSSTGWKMSVRASEPQPAVTVHGDRRAEAEQHRERSDDQGVQGRVDQHLAEERVAPQVMVVLEADPPGGGSGRKRWKEPSTETTSGQ